MFIYRKFLIEQLTQKESCNDGQVSSLIDANLHALITLKFSS